MQVGAPLHEHISLLPPRMMCRADRLVPKGKSRRFLPRPQPPTSTFPSLFALKGTLSQLGAYSNFCYPPAQRLGLATSSLGPLPFQQSVLSGYVWLVKLARHVTFVQGAGPVSIFTPKITPRM